jgi:hypothetical protein
VRDGAFRARVGRRGRHDLTLEAFYPGSDAHEPAAAQSRVVKVVAARRRPPRAARRRAQNSRRALWKN